MARTLSDVRRQPHGLLWIATTAVASLLGAEPVRGQNEIRVAPAEGTVIQNPFVRPGGEMIEAPEPMDDPTGALADRPADAVPSGSRAQELAITPSASPRIQRNPFARQTAAPPPFEIPIMPGPVSRWRQSQLPATGEGAIKGLILSAESTLGESDASEKRDVPWDQLPPGELIRQKQRHSSATVGWTPRRAPLPENLTLVPANLDQPTWINPDSTGEKLPAREADEAKVANGSGTADSNFDPFESDDLKKEADGEPAPFVASSDVATGTKDDREPALPIHLSAEPDTESVIIADYVDSAEGWHARAQHRAQSAVTRDDLLEVIANCERSIKSGAELGTAAMVNRLAAWAHNRCGELAIEAGREDQALHDFQAAITLDAECWLALHNRGVTLAERQDMDGALADFNRVIEINPGLTLAYRNRAELLASLGRMEEAVADYDVAIDRIPEDAQLFLGRGDALHRLGRYDEALADLDRCIELDPLTSSALTQRANLHAERGNFAAAIDDLKAALEIDPAFAEAHRSAAWLLATCPDPAFRDDAQALAAARQALDLVPNEDCYLLDALGAAHANAGQFNEAIDVQRRAIALAPPQTARTFEQRLALYERREPYRSGPQIGVEQASYQEPPGRNRARR